MNDVTFDDWEDLIDRCPECSTIGSLAEDSENSYEDWISWLYCSNCEFVFNYDEVMEIIKDADNE